MNPSSSDAFSGNRPALGPEPQECEFIVAHATPPPAWQAITTLPDLPAEQAHLAALFADARLLLWTARVRREGDDYTWELAIAPESLHSPLLNYTAYRRHGYLWHPAFAPDYEQTEATYRDALARGAERYQQQFRIMYRGRLVWLDELVRITAIGPDEWRLSGVVRDVTEQKVAEDAERRAKDELQRLLQHSQCMLFHAAVTQDPGGDFTWAINFLPSVLQRQVFPDAVGRTIAHLYDEFDVPQFPEMKARSAHALRTGATGYQQEFVITRKRDQRTFWLREYVTILPGAAGR